MINRSKILIVDDTPTAREVLEDLLAPQGYQLLFAHDGLTALETAVAETPDLILLDVMMPGMDGFAVCRQIRNTPGLAEIPVIMITALSDQKARLEGIEAGVDDFLTKPINRHELRLRVKTITSLNRYRRLLIERKKFEYVVTHASTGHLILDPQGQILFANLKAQKYLNDVMDETTETEWRDFRVVAQQSFRLEPTIAWNNWPDLTPKNMIRYLVRPESKWLKAQWLKVKTVSYEAENGLNWLVTLVDVTHQIEEIRDMRNFHHILSHKLRTPLVGLVSGMEIISKWGNTLTPHQLTELLGVAQASIQRLYGEIEDILQYVHISALSQPANRYPLNQLPELTEQIAMDIGLDLVTLQIPEACHTWEITASEKLLETVLYELLENAHKFHPDNMPIIEINVKQEADFLVLTVTDNGRHLAQEEIDRVWAPYYQIEKLFTGEIPGMGLGLATVASLVWQVNGYCQMTNRPDQPGVIVEIKLPIAPGNKPILETKETPMSAFKQVTHGL